MSAIVEKARQLSLPVPLAAELVGVSRDVLELAIKRGECMVRYPNSKPLVRIVDLEAWLESLPTQRPKKKAKAAQ